MASAQHPACLRVFDTTLRDGEQSPGATMTSSEKLRVAAALARLGVDTMEAGFPAASPDDLQAVRQIAEKVGTQARPEVTPAGEPPTICGLARATRHDIDSAWQAVQPAYKPRIHTFLATSDIHLKHKLRMTRDAVVERVGEMVSYARSVCPDVEFSPEDATRSDPEFLYRVLAAAIQAGATTLNIPDTVGYSTPAEFSALISNIMQNTPGIEKAVVSVHCHNDLGLATANTLAGIMAGARQVEVTVNGIGERAGNTSLEEVAMAVRTRPTEFSVQIGLDATQITHLSKLVSSCTGIVVQPNKAIVGANAFAHEAGIHQDGMLKHHATYEIMRPEAVGASQSTLVLGKHSGRHAIKARLDALGHKLSETDLDRAFRRFKELADKKRRIADADLEALVSDEMESDTQVYALDSMKVVCGTRDVPTATVHLREPDGTVSMREASGTGPVDAVYKAIDATIGRRPVLLEFSIQAITKGIDALGEVTVRVQSDRASTCVNPQTGTDVARTYVGHGAHTDIVVASAKAYLSAVNKLLLSEGRARGQRFSQSQCSATAGTG